VPVNTINANITEHKIDVMILELNVIASNFCSSLLMS